jgi:hypothetical protein
MRSRKALWLLVIALFATALVAVGCGGSDNKNSDSTATAAQTPPATTDTSGGDTSTPPATTDTSGGGGAADPQIQAAVDACKQQIAAAPNLKDATKADLNKICEDIKSGNAADIQKVAREVCGKIIDDSGIPDGPAKDQAKMACDSVGATP